MPALSPDTGAAWASAKMGSGELAAQLTRQLLPLLTPQLHAAPGAAANIVQAATIAQSLRAAAQQLVGGGRLARLRLGLARARRQRWALGGGRCGGMVADARSHATGFGFRGSSHPAGKHVQCTVA